MVDSYTLIVKSFSIYTIKHVRVDLFIIKFQNFHLGNVPDEEK